jgi:hypothetical protein
MFYGADGSYMGELVAAPINHRYADQVRTPHQPQSAAAVARHSGNAAEPPNPQ